MSKVATTGSWSRAGLLLGVSLSALVFTNPAIAQDATPEGVPTNEDVVQDEEGQNVPEGATTETDETTIVVTGSRIRQPEFTSPDPVSLIDPQIAQREGKTDTASMLQSSPIAAGSTQITSAISANFVTNGGPGAQTVDLRGLGPNRTLVLLNGRRAGPAGTRGAVSSFDLNVLPQSIISRVDILKTGASSIYGSDAVAGVVNLITKTEIDGFQIDGSTTVPFDSGGEQYRLTGLWGKVFDRGHVTLAADYFKQNELSRGDRRKYLECAEAYYFRPDANGNRTDQRADLIDPRTGEYKCEDLRWGHVWTYDVEYFYGYQGNLNLADGRSLSTIGGGVSLLQYQYPGENLGLPPVVSGPDALTQFIAPAGWFPTGYDTPSLAVQNSMHPFVLEQSIIPETERKTFYAEGAFKLNDSIELFGEFLFNRRETYQNGWRQFWNFGTTGNYYNAYYQFSSSDPAAAGWEGWNWLSATGITNGGSDASQRVDYYRGVGGLRGDLGGLFNGWSYDSYVQYSRSDGRYRNEQILQDAVYNLSYFQYYNCADPNNGSPWAGTTPISGKQCLDLPWYDPFFLRGEMTQEQRDYMFDWEEGRTIYTQVNGEFSVSGSLFELPGGPLGVALGVTARRDRVNDMPGDITYTENPFYDPSIPSNSSICNRPTAARRTLPCEQFVSNAWGASGATPTRGYTDTTEAFGEVSIPLLKDRPFFNLLSFSGAARVTNVKATHGITGQTDKDTGNWTYKLGVNWAPTDWLRFRGTYGTSFRAPALFEQFLGEEKSFIAQRSIDPCIRW
ncbi:MAG TPA: TonB-dependent receptor, partial [Sphingomicrobium sp.]|nr:TonB-dependent receptor [Sphingomicrobium sp.]